jgi:hypothetical protein
VNMHSWKLNSVCVHAVDQIKNTLTESEAVVNKVCLSHFSHDVFHPLRGCAGELCIFYLGYNLWLNHFNTPPKTHAWKCIKNVLWTFLCSSFKQLWFMYYMGKIWEFQQLSVYINNWNKRVALEFNDGWELLTWHTISCYI